MKTKLLKKARARMECTIVTAGLKTTRTIVHKNLNEKFTRFYTYDSIEKFNEFYRIYTLRYAYEIYNNKWYQNINLKVF